MSHRPTRHAPRVRFSLCAALLLGLAAALWAAVPAEPLLRFPDVRGDTVVFVCGEDIWSAPVAGGTATRLTIHDGEERHPKLSPDGTRIAFTGDYDGNADVYVMDVHGGGITRVTWHPGDDEVVGWHPTANKILFKSMRDSFNRFEKLFLVSPDGTGLEPLPLHEAAYGSYSPDGRQIAYNRVSVETRTWKRYRGGLAPDVYIYDFAAKKDRRITDFPGGDRMPMWHGGTIYYTADSDGVLNIYGYNVATGKTEPLTRHREHDVRRPSLGDGRIAYEVGGTVWLLDLASRQSRALPIAVRADAPETRPYLAGVADLLTHFDVSPSGARVLVTARGHLFSVPRKDGATRLMAGAGGARIREGAWSPDGRQYAYVSDAGGEYNIFLAEVGGTAAPVQLTRSKDGYRHTLRWSPDGKKIAFADQTLACYVLDVASRAVTRVDKADYEPMDVSLNVKPISDYAWSPDGAYLAYSKMEADLVSKVFVYSLQENRSRCVSNGLFNDFGPVFSRDGKHLFFISNRRFDPTFCDFEWEMVYKQAAGIYCLTLSREGAARFPLASDEETGAPAAPPAAPPAAAAAPPSVVIDFDGLAERIEAVPLPRGNYRQLAAGEGALYYLNAADGDFNRFEYRGPGARNLCAFAFDTRKERRLFEGADDFRLSGDGKWIVCRKGTGLSALEFKGPEPKAQELSLADLKVWIDPRAEWRQIFNESWRMERDFFYEPGMHGLDWPAMHARYLALLERATCRQDVVYILGELIGELNASHTYVGGGAQQRKADEIAVGLLGADYELDAASQRYRFRKICRVPDWTGEVQPPLAAVGVGVREGDYLLAVNGVEVRGDREVYAYFQDLAGKQVKILVNDKPERVGAREYTVKPLASERTLRYLDWVEHNRRIVAEASGGRIGYLHLPDTYTGSAREFPKYFYAQTQKEGIVVDGRFNGGGLDPDIFLQRLGKRAISYWTRRYSKDTATPAVWTQAHLVCLTNRQAGSGGDELPHEFQVEKMGPVIGTRSWGGLVGISMTIDLVDGGYLTAPDYRIYDRDGNWVVENVGVTPDIEVDLDPAEMARGHDAQLMKGVEVLLKKIEAEPRTWPKHPPYPRQKF